MSVGSSSGGGPASTGVIGDGGRRSRPETARRARGAFCAWPVGVDLTVSGADGARGGASVLSCSDGFGFVVAAGTSSCVVDAMGGWNPRMTYAVASAIALHIAPRATAFRRPGWLPGIGRVAGA